LLLYANFHVHTRCILYNKMFSTTILILQLLHIIINLNAIIIPKFNFNNISVFIFINFWMVLCTNLYIISLLHSYYFNWCAFWILFITNIPLYITVSLFLYYFVILYFCNYLFVLLLFLYDSLFYNFKIQVKIILRVTLKFENKN